MEPCVTMAKTQKLKNPQRHGHTAASPSASRRASRAQRHGPLAPGPARARLQRCAQPSPSGRRPLAASTSRRPGFGPLPWRNGRTAAHGLDANAPSFASCRSSWLLLRICFASRDRVSYAAVAALRARDGLLQT